MIARRRASRGSVRGAGGSGWRASRGSVRGAGGSGWPASLGGARFVARGWRPTGAEGPCSSSGGGSAPTQMRPAPGPPGPPGALAGPATRERWSRTGGGWSRVAVGHTAVRPSRPSLRGGGSMTRRSDSAGRTVTPMSRIGRARPQCASRPVVNTRISPRRTPFASPSARAVPAGEGATPSAVSAAATPPSMQHGPGRPRGQRSGGGATRRRRHTARWNEGDPRTPDDRYALHPCAIGSRRPSPNALPVTFSTGAACRRLYSLPFTIRSTRRTSSSGWPRRTISASGSRSST